jgi:hypothetical protein
MRRFLIVSIRTDISNVGIGEADNLSSVTWIGENFLISREACVENSFSTAAGFRTRGASNKNTPVFQRKRGGLSNLMGQRNLLKSCGLFSIELNSF